MQPAFVVRKTDFGAFQSYDFQTVFLAEIPGFPDHEKMNAAPVRYFALLVDDDRTERRVAAAALKARLDLEVMEAEDGSDCLRLLQESVDNFPRLVVLDLDMPGLGGLETLRNIKMLYPTLPVIVLTGSTSTQDAVEAMKRGAVDFLSKPADIERMVVSVRNALKMSVMAREINRLRRRSENVFLFTDLIGHGAGLEACVRAGLKAATSDFAVLIAGETGTGKEMFAQAIHGESARAGRPFITINCGAIPEKLVESTLFGHEKGAFTGAIAKSSGKFLEADGGTIFLDEIAELPLEAQVKLLRVLQEREVEPVGAGKSVPVNVRVLSATNRDLAEEVKRGRFRQDLYFRLNVLHILLPPLRERKNDIQDLARFFIDAFCAGREESPKTLTDGALRRLYEHTWPGNVRELQNVISRAVTFCEGSALEEKDLSFGDRFVEEKAGAPAAGNAYAVTVVDGEGSFRTMQAIEQEIISLGLAYHGNNISRTARALGMAKSTLYTKLGHGVRLRSV